MTEAEKRMKKYMSAVERHLELPPKIRCRVMSDLASSVQARREGGMTDEEIYEELGTPHQAAADLNEQMKEYAYRKSPWRFLFIPLALYGAAELLLGLTARLWILGLSLFEPMLQTGTATVGIIGGADGPTAIFVTTPGWLHSISPVLYLMIGVAGYVSLSRCRKKQE